MRCAVRPLFGLLFTLVVAGLGAQGQSGSVRLTLNPVDLEFLLEGVKEAAAGDLNGTLCVYGDRAFPVMAASSRSGALEPVMAAARLEHGRIIVFSHTAYLEQDTWAVADSLRLLKNVVQWLAARKNKPRIGVYKIDGLAARLRGLGWDARDIQLDGRPTVDVILLLGRMVRDADVTTLLRYIRNGGGLAIGAVGFLLEARSPDKDLGTEVPANRLTAEAGVVFGRGVVDSGNFQITGPPAELLHAGRAMDLYESGALTWPQVRQARVTLLRAAADLPQDDHSVLPRLNRVKGKALPTPTTPLKEEDLASCLALACEVRRLRRAPPERTPAHPAAEAFPGSVPREAPRITAQVLVQPSGWRTGWFGAGLYAAPGETVIVRVPPAFADKGLSVIVGAHTDLLWDQPAWYRVPQISVQRPIRKPETLVANAFGGAIYLSVPEGARVGDFVATVTGAVRSPRYVHGQTSSDEWRASIRALPGPWAEMESDKIVLTIPSSVIRKLEDPAALMNEWEKISDLVSDLAGLPDWRARAERMVTDVQISVGIMHAGYPVMMNLNRAETLVSVGDLRHCPFGERAQDKDTGGFFHELGHNVQSPLWVFDGAAEPTASLFPLYVFEKHCGIPVSSHPRGNPEFRRQQITRLHTGKGNFELWKVDQLLNLTMYVQMQQAFGWDAFKRVFAQYLMLPESEQPKSDAEKRDQWLVRFSRQVRRNLGPFFQAWGVPTTEEARASISDLPVWMPEELAAPR